jgi:hypothetical protein
LAQNSLAGKSKFIEEEITMKETIHTCTKSDTEEIRFAIGTYKDRTYLDIRVWFQVTGETEWHPSKKGITVPVELIKQLYKGLDLAERRVAQGLAPVKQEGTP